LRNLLLIVVFVATLGSSDLLAQRKYAPVPDKVLMAKTVYLDDQSGYPGVNDKAYEELTKWGRFKVVSNRKDADLILLLSSRAYTGGYMTTSSGQVYSSAQEVRTVAQCRAYREAWRTSMDTDIKNLTVRELLQRAEQMMTCGREIDSNPFQAGMTHGQALDIAMGETSYAILAADYYQEAFDRAAWYIDKRGLSKDFIAEDESGKLVQHRHEQPKKHYKLFQNPP